MICFKWREQLGVYSVVKGKEVREAGKLHSVQSNLSKWTHHGQTLNDPFR